MKIVLLHGRKNTTTDMDDWGCVGPTLWRIKYVHITYLSEYMVSFMDEMSCSAVKSVTGWDSMDSRTLRMRIVDDCVHAGDMYYGDWELQENSA